jgi:hypothetical protein
MVHLTEHPHLGHTLESRMPTKTPRGEELTPEQQRTTQARHHRR